MQVPNWFSYPSTFVDVGEILIMANDVVMPLNLPVAPVEQEKLERAPFDVNVYQRPCEKEPSKQVVRTRVDCSAWDHQLSPNPHALVI
jgi:hypothetical protein